MDDILFAIWSSMIMGLQAVIEYLTAHVITCLVPALFIAGAIAAFIKKDAILRYFGPDVKRWISYPIAAVSGTVLAVCSCTILPLFAGIYKKGSGLGPAVAFLYAGPAINVLAIFYTAKVLGWDLGAARAISAVLMAILIGLLMNLIFKKGELGRKIEGTRRSMMDLDDNSRPGWATILFFMTLMGILIFGASGLPIVMKLTIVLILIVLMSALIIRFLKKDEFSDWMDETWDLTRKIMPVLILGTFVVGAISYFLPPETFKPLLGNNMIQSNLMASAIGAILYMPTLLEVPIIGTTFGYTSGDMAAGPALSLLLAGPAVSLPNMIVLYRIMGGKRTAAYISLVIVMSTMAGFIYGNIFG